MTTPFDFPLVCVHVTYPLCRSLGVEDDKLNSWDVLPIFRSLDSAW